MHVTFDLQEVKEKWYQILAHGHVQGSGTETKGKVPQQAKGLGSNLSEETVWIIAFSFFSYIELGILWQFGWVQ